MSSNLSVLRGNLKNTQYQTSRTHKLKAQHQRTQLYHTASRYTQEHKNTRARERKKWNELFSSMSHVPPLPLQRSDALAKGIGLLFFIQSYPGN
ncbi:hypothetical protein IGI04_015214 [Brassica rapa subsp. trilocularis]|uniref:BHLH domain-containing protein n=1 Tax=Brassica rapa subsp. trilocularis TaxID=1813537 RepID=A0ABQ7MPE8_BRACM|nr:hypothetical protein IGI04_015214 [Brassica rapa subsp. trilocularis]